MTAINKESAQALYTILNSEIGVFRQAEMSEGATKFHEKKQQEFVETFTEQIPESYWFQGIDCPSVTLNFDSNGFHLTAPTHENSKVEKVIASTNRKIDEANFTIIG